MKPAFLQANVWEESEVGKPRGFHQALLPLTSSSALNQSWSTPATTLPAPVGTVWAIGGYTETGCLYCWLQSAQWWCLFWAAVHELKAMDNKLHCPIFPKGPVLLCRPIWLLHSVAAMFSNVWQWRYTSLPMYGQRTPSYVELSFKLCILTGSLP